MTEPAPNACSLEARALEVRLAAVSEVGRAGLISRKRVGRGHLLRFKADAETRARLKRIVRAEQECCSFLDLRLEEDPPELVLSIEAAAGAEAIADELAAAFDGVAA
jgi:hypothetical protein